MIRLTVALVGLIVFGAVFAFIYYDPDNEVKVRSAPVFQLAPGEARQTVLQPTIAGTPIVVQLNIVGNPIDIYLLEKDWSDPLARDGRLNLDQPFSHDAARSRVGVTGLIEFAIVSDGQTDYVLVFDNGDNYYANDTTPLNDTQGTVSIQMTVRYVEEEERSLLLGYIAAAPSVILVAITLGRKLRRLQTQRARSRQTRDGK